ncbi:MAG TPA: hypothetical protein VE961_18805, partial [Pyrinomonadaceae bacterium]|nr:hypothetical protein [Pyrinomonadaceae bacterium]
MNYVTSLQQKSHRQLYAWATSLVLLLLVVLAAPVSSYAQSIVGYLSNFDAVNNTEQDVHGLEIQLEGLQAKDVYYSFSSNRYGQPKVISYSTGVYVRWESPVIASNGFFTATTIPHAPGTPFGGTCYMWNTATYDTAGCEHFGVSLTANPAAVTYHWLVGDPAAPGTLTTFGTPVEIPQPTWVIIPPAQPAAAPVVVAEINAPEAANPAQFGDAQWVKVFKTELPREVGLDELMSDNPVVPQDAAQVETAWKLIQSSPPTSRKQKGKVTNSGSLGGSSHAVLRRYEFYTYTGLYDPLTHEAVCGGDGTCSTPQPGELGDAIGAQNAAANVNVPSVVVSTTGNGGVSSSDKVISCGNKCAATYSLGTIVTLVASPGSGSAFGGWGGACSGNQSTCSVLVNDAMNVTATFLSQFTLSVGKSNSGSITGSPAGNDRAL